MLRPAVLASLRAAGALLLRARPATIRDGARLPGSARARVPTDSIRYCQLKSAFTDIARQTTILTHESDFAVREVHCDEGVAYVLAALGLDV